MTALELIRRVRGSGCRIRVEAHELIVESDREPPTEMLDELRRHKAEVIAFLTAPDRSSTPYTAAETGTAGITSAQLREWFVIQSRSLGGERILVVANPDAEEEARRAHPEMVVYMSWEVRTLLAKDTSPAFAQRFHRLKAMFDAVILPEPEMTA